MLRQPEYVSADVFNLALAECRKKKPELAGEKRDWIVLLKGGACR
jgi:hypothetical protein